jgi:hypothetical protein
VELRSATLISILLAAINALFHSITSAFPLLISGTITVVLFIAVVVIVALGLTGAISVGLCRCNRN